ncbi:MFS transporter [Shewanella sp. D64]|uniref:MFS transporter n=1 Tax=unclassified Shewanella TaxID=196818 RepID=UPI0022BA2F2B|nr:MULTISPECIES: MFS transporter [unclassified Shewanella]MEC4724615.1 MFS transporter [Shewanella sp. D64]MEC4736608.1 MFS transporter [Shewanella sp. E94]WBJ94719.1 MFS transporter [Shewanella sp. MTB7]
MNNNTASGTKQGFPRTFWIANGVELLERAAYYGVFIVITLYLSRILGFTDVEAAWLAGSFSAGLYLLPTFSGALADKIGFRSALLLAFALLTIGYSGLAIFPALLEGKGLVEYGRDVTYHGLQSADIRWAIIPILIVIMIGGSFIKAVITATVAKSTTTANRAKGFSIFYMMVNIGAFSGKTVVKPLRESMGDLGLINLNYFAAGMTLVAFISIFFFFKNAESNTEGKSMAEVVRALGKVLTNGRLIALILIITGFWMVQHQLYATMPKYVLRMAGEGASPSWYANVNPLVVFLTVGFVTSLMSRKSALFSMTIGMFIMPFSALLMASGNMLEGNIDLGFMQMHPIAAMMILGIMFQGLAESFISPRFLEYFSLQAPKGEEGLYLGFSHLHSFISSLLGFGLSGYLLQAYCPDPRTFESHEAWVSASANAHYIWYVFAAIATVSAISLIIYGVVIKRLDADKPNDVEAVIA